MKWETDCDKKLRSCFSFPFRSRALPLLLIALFLFDQVNLRLALSVQFHTRWHYIAIYGSIALWLAFVCAYNALPLGTLGSIARQVEHLSVSSSRLFVLMLVCSSVVCSFVFRAFLRVQIFWRGCCSAQLSSVDAGCYQPESALCTLQCRRTLFGSSSYSCAGQPPGCAYRSVSAHCGNATCLHRCHDFCPAHTCSETLLCRHCCQITHLAQHPTVCIYSSHICLSALQSCRRGGVPAAARRDRGRHAGFLPARRAHHPGV